MIEVNRTMPDESACGRSDLMAIIPEFFKDAVLALGRDDIAGNRIWIGTGFLVGQKNKDDTSNVYVITNKHVVEDESVLLVRFNNVDGTDAKDLIMTLKDKDGKNDYSMHPIPDVDVVAIMINPNIIAQNNLKLTWIDIDDNALSLQQMKDTGVDEGILVYSLGFPMNLQKVNAIKAPICRLGCVSRISDAFLNPNLATNFLVDTPVYPGNSGGPVINRPEIVSIEQTPRNSKANLIGVLSGYITYKETLISTQTKRTRMIQEENSGLTIVHPVDRIREVVEIEWQRVLNKQTTIQS